MDAGADINAKDSQGANPLMVAVLNGHVHEVRTLVEAGADVNGRQDATGWTILMHAVTREIVEALLEAGADVNARDKLGNTALISASWEGYVEIVPVLLEAGADLDARNEEDKSALMGAIDQEHAEIVQMLKDAGAA